MVLKQNFRTKFCDNEQARLRGIFMSIINTATLSSNIQSDTGNIVTATTKSNSTTNNMDTDVLVKKTTPKN